MGLKAFWKLDRGWILGKTPSIKQLVKLSPLQRITWLFFRLVLMTRTNDASAWTSRKSCPSQILQTVLNELKNWKKTNYTHSNFSGGSIWKKVKRGKKGGENACKSNKQRQVFHSLTIFKRCLMEFGECVKRMNPLRENRSFPLFS